MPSRLTALLTLALAAAAMFSLLGASSAFAVGSGSIAGTVTAAAGGAPIEEIHVCAEASGIGFGGCDYTDADGAYTISGLAPGSYKVAFSVTPGSGLNYIAQYFDGAGSWVEADPVTVADGATKSGVDAEMQAGGRIAGEVTAAAGGAPLDSIEVCALVDTAGPGALVGCAATDADGKYAIASLPSGSYKIRFAPGFGEISAGEFGRANYVTQYFSGKASKAQADAVTATAGATTPDVDAAMAVGGVVSGLVTDAVSGDPIEGVQVCPFQGSEEATGCDFTDVDGKYSISGLATGSYKIGFTPGFGDGTHARQYYDGKATLAAANAVAVTEGGTAGGIDAELVEQGGIAGKSHRHQRWRTAGGHRSLREHERLRKLRLRLRPHRRQRRLRDCRPAGKLLLPGRIQRRSRPRHRVLRRQDLEPRRHPGRGLQRDHDRLDRRRARDAPARSAAKSSTRRAKRRCRTSSVCAQTPSGSPIGPGACALTGADGKYTINGLRAGSYSVRFSVPSSTSSTTCPSTTTGVSAKAKRTPSPSWPERRPRDRRGNASRRARSKGK